MSAVVTFFSNESAQKILCSELAGARVKCQEQKYSVAISGVMNQVENHACQQCRRVASPVDGGVFFHLKGKQFAGILPVKSCLDISCHYEHNVLDYRMNSNGVHVKMSTDLQLAEVNMSICGYKEPRLLMRGRIQSVGESFVKTFTHQVALLSLAAQLHQARDDQPLSALRGALMTRLIPPRNDATPVPPSPEQLLSSYSLLNRPGGDWVICVIWACNCPPEVANPVI